MLSHQGTQILAGTILFATTTVTVAWIALWFRRSRYTPAQQFCYFYGYVMARILWRADIEGQLAVSSNQGAIIICNHRSPYDPAFIQLVSDRVVHWMVAREYCCHPALAWFFRIVQSIPVSRGGIDTAATKMAIRYAQAGGLVGLFPEGRLNMTDQILLPGRPGVALIALKTHMPVIPCYISGSPFSGNIISTLFLPARTRLKVGNPIDISPFYDRDNNRQTLEDLTRLFLTEIVKLAGNEDFQPQLAGRRWKP